MSLSGRIKEASKAAGVHLLGSLLVACLAALIVFLLWYPSPYGELSGGRNLFAILIAVDVVCGPLLTLVLFNPQKSRLELVVDLALVVLIQFAALGFGLYTAYLARPIYLVHEVDRFRVISEPDYGDVDVGAAIAALPEALRPKLFGGPVSVGIRFPDDKQERKNVMVESVFGGRDYAQRPEYYVPYDSQYRQSFTLKARSLGLFLKRFPEQAAAASKLVEATGVDATSMKFLPVLHKQEWVAVLKPTGEIAGFLPGDGFSVP